MLFTLHRHHSPQQGRDFEIKKVQLFRVVPDDVLLGGVYSLANLVDCDPISQSRMQLTSVVAAERM
jgi:hypothetical protein